MISVKDPIVEFQAETGLILRPNYAGDYYECSGKSYKDIKSRIKQYNMNHGTMVSCYDDPMKDVTTIRL